MQQFDLFPSSKTAPVKAAASSTMKRQPTAALSEDDRVRQLHATGRYRILKKLEPRSVTTTPRLEFPLKGVILDTPWRA
ncbi:hypothetical protein [Sinorhizobium sp. BJ1]|uniref:hypothetical protein n=1 Tax=Sinorhizobium sp. BJ1 TaxID=2035455 RepID=UPI0026D812D2